MPPYPSRLIPTAWQIKITDDLPCQDLLCRWVTPGLQLMDKKESLTAEAVEESKLFGYSLNKIPPSQIEDIYICLKDPDKYNQPWLEGSDGIVPGEDEFFLDKGRGFFLLRIQDVHKYGNEYPYPANAEENNYRYMVEVVHKPLIANYAHFEFHLKFCEKNGMDETKAPSRKSKKVITADLRQHLIKKARFRVEDFQ